MLPPGCARGGAGRGDRRLAFQVRPSPPLSFSPLFLFSVPAWLTLFLPARSKSGSTAHAWVLKDAPDLAARSLFVDPVVFCLWEGGPSPLFPSPSSPLLLAR